MPEWSNGPHSKCGVLLRVPWVRIPVSPPEKDTSWVSFLLCLNWSLQAIPPGALHLSRIPLKRIEKKWLSIIGKMLNHYGRKG